MPTPFSVTSDATSLPVWTVDDSGNVTQVGNLTVKGVVLNAGNQTITGNLTVVGTTTTAGLTSSGRETINGKDTGGLLLISNTQSAVPADMLISEAAVTNIAFAVQVTADTVPRLTMDASGKLLWGPGNGVGDTDLYRVAGGILQTDGTFQVLLDQNVGGNINAITVGKGLTVKEGSNARMGTAVLVAGSAVVANTSVTANSRIFVDRQISGGTPGFIGVSARTPGTSFTITGIATDTSTVAWLMVEGT